MKIEFYGKIAVAFEGSPEVSLPEEGMRVLSLRNHLSTKYDVEELRSSFIRAVVNDEFVREDHLVRPGDSVAFLSPVSGG